MIKLINISVSFGSDPILDDVSWMLGDQDRVGLVGENGSGKSTLLKVMAREIQPERGEIEVARGQEIGYLPQSGVVHSGATLEQEMRKAFKSIQQLEAEYQSLEHRLGKEDLSEEERNRLLYRMSELMDQFRIRGGYEQDARIGRVLKGLGFSESEWQRPVDEFSGGWQMRIALAKILIQEPQVLLLDEPTNHLDLDARNWLEEFLKSYPYSYLVVSHDRYFLDVTVDKIVEIDGGKLTSFYGNYSYYFEEKQKRVEAHQRAYEKQQEEIARIRAFIDKYKADKKRAGQTRDRMKRLEKMELIEAPRATKPVRFKFPEPPRGPHDMVVLKDIVVKYGDYIVFNGENLILTRGEKVAVVGPNGAGKSTLMAVLSGRKPIDGGVRKVGDTVRIAYFGQDAGEELDPEDTVYEAIMKDAPFEMIPSLRGLLGAFLFSGDDIEKKVKVLSGGEKSRLALAKLLLRPANLLLLDEPTNHLDLRAKEVLMNAFRDYTGTLIFVAHDRYFMEDLPDRIIEVNNHKITSYPGDYTDYLYAKEREARSAVANASLAQTPAPEPAHKSLKEEKPKEKDERIRLREEEKVRTRLLQKRKKRLEELESLIEQAEGNLKKIEQEMFSPAIASNYAKIMELTIAKKDLEQKLESLYQEWEKLQDEISRAESEAGYKLIKKQ